MKQNFGILSISPAYLGGFFAVLMIGLAGIGGVLNYSAIPFWDTWDAALSMMLRLHDGDTTVWWSQHNEHRLILARALIWFDFKFFDGMGYFLVFFNYGLCAISGVIFYCFMEKINYHDNNSKNKTNRMALYFFLIGSTFLWTQVENFVLGLNCNFFMAQLLPLIAFYCLARSSVSGSRRDFLIASLFGTLSAGTLASGVVIAPLMLGYVLVLRQGLARAATLGVISITIMFYYFNGYVTPSEHGYAGSAFIHHPIGVFNYAMMFLGCPFNFLVGGGRLGKLVALNSGIVFTIMFAALVLRWIYTVEKSPFTAALLLFIAYIGISAVATGGGRLVLGEASAFASRYTTPAIMGWVALLLLLWHRSGDRPATNTRRPVIFFTAIGALMLAYQVQALRNASATLFPREVAALALSLDINDEAAIRKIYPVPHRALMLSRAALPLGLSIFGQPPYAGLWHEMGTPLALPEAPACLGALDAAIPVAGAPAYIQVTGWLIDPQTRSAPKTIRFIGDQGLVEGIAMVGQRRNQVGKTIDRDTGYAGFVGYLRAGSAGTSVTATGGGAGCRISFHIPPLT